MKKKNIKWSVKQLQKHYEAIEFPEFQREPSVWGLDKKRKLIDSILRNFDMASIYLYKRKDGIYECIDGRQRINALLSFTGLNEEDSLNNFKFVSDDELLGKSSLQKYTNKIWRELKGDLRDRILDYEFNVVEITDIDRDDAELNLMFLRLQLGAALNAGEKLNAMVGDMRELVFKGIGKHKFFEYLNIPKRRFSKELTASQIAINFFAKSNGESYERARFIDMQEFYKKYLTFTPDDERVARLLKKRLSDVYAYLPAKTNKINLKNRAIGVTVFFFINSLINNGNENNINSFIKFINEFLKRLKIQVGKGIDIEPRYRDLLKFQTYISQAAVEKYAIENRQKFLEDYFDYYLKSRGKIKGDK